MAGLKGFLDYVSDSSRVRVLKAEVAKKSELVSLGHAEIAHYRELMAELPDPATITDIEQNLATLSNCILAEVRTGPRVTQRTGTSGGRTLLGTRVGPVYLGGMSAANNSSTSVSYPGVEELTQIDTGSVTVTTEQVSFVGEKYTRTIEFKKIAATHGEANWMRFASTSSEKVWTVAFERPSEMWVVGVLVQIAQSLRGHTIDLSGKATSEEIVKAFKDVYEEQDADMLKVLSEAIEDVEKSKDGLRELFKKYPDKVEDPGPRQTASLEA